MIRLEVFILLIGGIVIPCISKPQDINDFNKIISSCIKQQNVATDIKMPDEKLIREIEMITEVLLESIPPYLSKFKHHGNNIFYKPQILLGSTLNPPFISHILENNEEKSQEKPISVNRNENFKIVENLDLINEKTNEKLPHIPEAPILPPLKMPVLPEVVDVHILENNEEKSQEKPMLVNRNENFKIVENLDLINEKTNEKLPDIPEAPILPALKMPVLPEVVDVNILENNEEKSQEKLISVHRNEHFKIVENLDLINEKTNEKLPDIPEAPILPALKMPVLPEVIDVHILENNEEKSQEKPILVNRNENFKIVENLDLINEKTNEKLPDIPEAPMLPALKMPVLPEVVDVHILENNEEKSQEKPILVNRNENFKIVENIDLINEKTNEKLPDIPEALMLPALKMPVLPEVVDVNILENNEEKSQEKPILENRNENFKIVENLDLINEKTNDNLPDIPEAPILPPLKMPVLPEVVVEQPQGGIIKESPAPVEQVTIQQKPIVKQPMLIHSRLPITIPKPAPHLPTCISLNMGNNGVSIPCIPSFSTLQYNKLTDFNNMVQRKDFIRPSTPLLLPKIPLGFEFNKPIKTVMPFREGLISTTRFLPSVTISKFPLNHLNYIHNSEKIPSSSFPAYCAHNIAVGRVLPNIAEKLETMQAAPFSSRLGLPITPIL